MIIKFTFNQDLENIFKLLNYNCRLVGGCVRDYILYSKVVFDIDIATPFLPNEVIKLLSKDYKVIPTGICHGTVSVFGEKKYEITTLRKDDLTDGRHAKVSFNSSYEEDAKRRDFTINALYLDYNGNVYDYFDSLNDLKDRKVKFIGNATSRIKEDYLRILRFFRFSTRFGNLDQEGLNACYELKDGLKNISKERITEEWFKIISNHYFFKFILAFKPIMDTINLKSSNYDKKYNQLTPLGFTSLFYNDSSLLRLSNYQKKYLVLLNNCSLKNQQDANFIYNKFGEDILNDKMILTGKQFEKITIPKMLLSGKDITKLGVQGVKIGQILRKIEKDWYSSFGKLRKDQLHELVLNYAK